MQAQLIEFIGQQIEPAEHQARNQHGQQGREYPAYAPPVELGETETTLLQVLEDDRRDEVAGYDEEDIHADKTSAAPTREGVEENHGQHGEGAQAVDIGAVLRGAVKSAELPVDSGAAIELWMPVDPTGRLPVPRRP